MKPLLNRFKTVLTRFDPCFISIVEHVQNYADYDIDREGAEATSARTIDMSLVSSLKLSSFALAKPLRSRIAELIALVEGGRDGA